MSYDKDDIEHRADLLRDLRELGAVELRKPKRTIGFERRKERADDRPRVERGDYIGHLADQE